MMTAIDHQLDIIHASYNTSTDFARSVFLDIFSAHEKHDLDRGQHDILIIPLDRRSRSISVSKY